MRMRSPVCASPQPLSVPMGSLILIQAVTRARAGAGADLLSGTGGRWCWCGAELQELPAGTWG